MLGQLLERQLLPALTHGFDLRSMNFTLPLNATGGRGMPRTDLTVWGRGFYRELDIVDGRTSLDGDVVGGTVGLDVHRNDWLLGLGVSHAVADMDFVVRDPASPRPVDGTHETTLSGVHPYFGWQATDSLRLWGTVGIARGDLEVVQAARPEDATKDDIEQTSFSFGGSGTLRETAGAGRTSRLSVIGDVGYSQLDQEEGLNPVDVESGWVRAGLEMQRQQTLGADRTLGVSAALTYRQDFGDSIEGGGVELEGGLNLGFPRQGLHLDLKLRTLVGHEDDIEDWGVSGGFVLRSPQGRSGRGLSLEFQPQWGSMASAGDRLWDGGVKDLASQSGGSAASAHNLKLEYGMPVWSGQETLRMFARGSMGDSRMLGLGAALDLSEALVAGYETTLRPDASSASSGDEHRIYIQFQSRF